MNWCERTERIRHDLRHDRTSVSEAGGVEIYEYLIGCLVEYALANNLSPVQIANLSLEVLAETAKEFGRLSFVDDLRARGGLETHFEHCRSELERLGIWSSEEQLRVLAIVDSMFFFIGTYLSGILKGGDDENRGRYVRIKYRHHDGMKTFVVPGIAMDKDIVREAGLRCRTMDNLPFDFVCEAGMDEYATDMLANLVVDFGNLLEFAKANNCSEPWMKELSKLKVVYLSERLDTSYAFGLESASDESVLLLGLKSKISEFLFSVVSSIVHETQHLADFRKLKLMGIRHQSAILFELAAEMAALKRAESLGITEVVDFLRGSVKPYISVASGDLGSVVLTPEWGLVRGYFAGVDDPRTWERILNAWDKVLK